MRLEASQSETQSHLPLAVFVRPIMEDRTEEEDGRRTDGPKCGEGERRPGFEEVPLTPGHPSRLEEMCIPWAPSLNKRQFMVRLHLKAGGGRTEAAVEMTCALSSTTTWRCECASATTTACAPIPPPTSTRNDPSGRFSHENPMCRVDISVSCRHEGTWDSDIPRRISFSASHWRVPAIPWLNRTSLLLFSGS